MQIQDPHAHPEHTLTDFDVFLFKQGRHLDIYEKLGSHIVHKNGTPGVQFAVWAPQARYVSVVGNFNHWDHRAHVLHARSDGSGIWEGFVPGLGKGEVYKYFILSWDGRKLFKGDPYAYLWETPPQTASVTWDLNYTWGDREWMSQRAHKNSYDQPCSVYEVHLGSWQRPGDGRTFLTYREMAHALVPYVKNMGFTHVEFMPVMEHPYFPSWGYQVTGYFAPSSRFGTPQDFMYLVDQFHQAGIGVILDWVPSHFPTDAHGLADFDGTHLYNHADPRQGFHPDWKTYIFNFGRNEVSNFLIANALFWLKYYHIDGLRVDAVASMLYLDYSREDGQWIPNKYGGNENLEAIQFLKTFNKTVYQQFPDTFTIAEESTAWPGISKPVHEGGLGFGQKWMMGWMHDSLRYFKRDPIHRRYHHDELTFSMVYAFSENFMLPFSHDEVVHGKASMIYKMPGSEKDKFAQLRLLYGYMFTHPGTKLLFMGQEFGQTNEWDFQAELRWDLLRYDAHRSLQNWVRQLNFFYRQQRALYFRQFSQQGFQWAIGDDRNNSILSYFRFSDNPADTLLVVCNFTPIKHPVYEIQVPFGGTWVQILNSDHIDFGGSMEVTHQSPQAQRIYRQYRPFRIRIAIPPFGVLVFKPDPATLIVPKSLSETSPWLAQPIRDAATLARLS